MLRGLSIKALVIGVVTDWVVSVFLGIAVVIWIVVGLMAQYPGQSPDMFALDLALKAPSTCSAISLAGGLISLIPGFVTGWIARTQRVKNALVMSVASAVTSCVFLPFTHGYPGWYFPVCTLTSLIGCAIGRFLSDVAFGQRRIANEETA